MSAALDPVAEHRTIHVAVPKTPGQDDAFFYDGVVAWKGCWYLTAVGSIRIVDSTDGELVYDGKNRGRGMPPINNDDDLERLVSAEGDEGFQYWYQENNWFEVVCQHGDDTGEAVYSYEEGMRLLEEAVHSEGFPVKITQ